jgi:replicative DNA helicase
MLDLSDYKEVKNRRVREAGSFGISDPSAIEKMIPHNPEAEEAVIGSLLIDRDIILKVSGILEPSDFFSLERSSIYQAILDLYANRAPADLITLRNELRERGLLGEEEGQVRSSYLINLMRATPTPVHVRHYAEIVRKYSALRKLITFGARATTAGFAVQEEPGTAFAEVATQLQELLNWWKRGQEQDYFMRHEASLDQRAGHCFKR